MRDVLAKMREISQNAGFPRTIAGRLTPMEYSKREYQDLGDPLRIVNILRGPRTVHYREVLLCIAQK